MTEITDFLERLEERVRTVGTMGPWAIRPSPKVLALLRTVFTEKEIEDIFKGDGPGWDSFLELWDD